MISRGPEKAAETKVPLWGRLIGFSPPSHSFQGMKRSTEFVIKAADRA